MPRPLDRLHADARRRRDLGRRGAAQAAGFTKVNILASQRTPDGDFPNVPGHVSNPEIPKTLDASIAEAKATGADLVLASDPDADRIGVGLPVTGDPAGRMDDPRRQPDRRPARGLRHRSRPSDSASSAPTITSSRRWSSTQMARALAEREGVRIEDDLLVGFKWIAQRIDEVGPAGSSSASRSRTATSRGRTSATRTPPSPRCSSPSWPPTVKDGKQTVLEYLDDLYIDVGHYGERLINKALEGREGVAQIQKLMAAFRSSPPEEGRRAGRRPRSTTTRRTRSAISRAMAAPTPLPEPSGDMLIFHTDAPARGSPSGRRGPSRRSSSTSSPGPTHRRDGPRSKLAEIKASDGDRLDRDRRRTSNNYIKRHSPTVDRRPHGEGPRRTPMSATRRPKTHGPREKVREFPTSPGVYLMKDAQGG